MWRLAKMSVRIALVCFLAGVSGWAQIPQGNQGRTGASVSELQQMKESIKKLEGQISELAKRVKGSEDKVTALERMRLQHVVRIMNLEGRNKTIDLDPSSLGKFDRMDTDIGAFLVSIEAVTPYLDGVKVKLHIGNLLQAAYTGFSLKIRWGIRLDLEKSYEEWDKKLKEKEETYTQYLYPGIWNICPRINKGKYKSTKRPKISEDLNWVMLNTSENAVQSPYKLLFTYEIAIVRPSDSGVVPEPFGRIQFW